MNFPLFKTKQSNLKKVFDLNDPLDRRRYFFAKAGKEIKWLQGYLEQNRFLAFLLAKKAAGKGTYSKMLTEVLGEDKIAHLSVGDMIRETHKSLQKGKGTKCYWRDEVLQETAKHYRGHIPFSKAIESLLARSQDKLLPTELILALLKKEIQKYPRAAILIDGFPRTQDQIDYALYFREIMGLGQTPDLFILIDVPEAVIDARLKSRVVCPLCQTSRNTYLLPTKFVEYQKSSQQFVLKCDNQSCAGFANEVLTAKEGDKLGIESIRERLNLDGKLVQKVDNLHGIRRIYVRNAIPVKKAAELVDAYEITPRYLFEWDKKKNQVKQKQVPWIIKDNFGIDNYSLLAPAAVVSLISQLYQNLHQPKYSA